MTTKAQRRPAFRFRWCFKKVWKLAVNLLISFNPVIERRRVDLLWFHMVGLLVEVYIDSLALISL